MVFTIKQDDYEKLTLNEQISVIGYVTDAEEGAKFKSKGGNTFDITAQGWNAFKQ
jgi:thiamine-monophosphate kinase